MIFVFRDSYVLCIYVTNILCMFHAYPYLAMVQNKKISSWLRKRNFKRETEFLLIEAQNNDIRTNKFKYGEFYKPWKARFIPTFCKRINRTSTAVGIWVRAFEERRQTTFSVTKFIYNSNSNKQDFTPNGTNNEYVRVQKRVQDSNRW